MNTKPKQRQRTNAMHNEYYLLWFEGKGRYIVTDVVDAVKENKKGLVIGSFSGVEFPFRFIENLKNKVNVNPMMTKAMEDFIKIVKP